MKPTNFKKTVAFLWWLKCSYLLPPSGSIASLPSVMKNVNKFILKHPLD